jgi:twitching motility protein PilT
MALGIFGLKKPIERAKANDWKNAEEKDALIQELKDARVKSRDAIPLIWSSDSGIRQVGVEKFLEGADVASVDALFGQLPSQSRHAIAFVQRLVPRMPEEAVEKALGKLVHNPDKRAQRLGWQLAMEAKGAAREKWLLRALEEAPPSVQVTAARGLVHDNKVNAHLDLFLGQARAEGDLSTVALEAVTDIEDPRVTELMIDRFAHGDATARDHASRYLRSRAAADPKGMRMKMLQLLGEGDDATRWAAIDALAQIGSPAALKHLSKQLRDKRPEVRGEIVRAFGRFDDKRLIPLLQQVIQKDPSSEVRTRAAEVVRDLSARLNVAVDGSKSEPTSAVHSDSLSRPIDKLLAQIREMGASDMHISMDEPPLIRINGKLERMDGWPALSASSTSKAVLSLLSPKQRAQFKDVGELDFCYAIPEVGRYRTNAYVQRKGIGAAFRVIPNVPPTFADIRLPGKLTELLDYHQGLIMVSGPASSGKSTTLAAIINLINESKSTHVITLEDPIEFVHPVKTALVNQREVGKHTESFARALRGALRQDPDVIMVGEMRDPETIRMALEASETGHLVIATMHTTSAVQTVERLIQSFPPEEQQQVRTSLSESLKWVVCQSLIPRHDGEGRVAVFELLKNTFSVGNLIRDEKTYQIPSQMQIGRRHGMQTVDVALEELVESKIITPETAWMRAESPDVFAPMCAPGFIQKQTSLDPDAKADAAEEAK